jgi:hypothetical protein
MTEDGSAPADTMRERAGASRFKLWLFVEANRALVVLGIVAVLYVALVLAGVLVPGARELLASGDPIETAFQAFIGATITGVTLVLTLNQLVLSQELGAVGDQRERMEGALSFRRDAEDILDVAVAPSDPADFIGALVERTGDHASTLRESVGPAVDDDLAQRVRTLADDVEGNASAVSDQLEGARFGTFDVVSGALNFNYSWKIDRARRLRAEAGGELPAEAVEALDELLDTLELFGPAREHFKTLYVQWALVDLSRWIFAASFPSLVVATATVFYFHPEALTGVVLGVPTSVVLVSAGVAVALLPFAVLLSYVVRIATVTKRTLSIGAFTLRDTGGEARD